MNAKQIEPWVKVPQIAQHLSQRKEWVRKYAPLMPHTRVGREYRFRISEVDAWLNGWRGGERV